MNELSTYLWGHLSRGGGADVLLRVEKETAPIATENVTALIQKLAEPSRSIAALLGMTGLRIGELLALRWQDVDLENGFLSVNRSVYEGHFDQPKSKRSKRRVPLGPNSVEILRSIPRKNADPSALILCGAQRCPTQPEESAQSSTETGLQGARLDRSELALATACQCNSARFCWGSSRHGPSSARSFFLCTHA